MESIKDALKRVKEKKKFLVISSLDGTLPRPIKEVCPICKDRGFVKQGSTHNPTLSEFGPHTEYKNTLVHCPACSAGRRAKRQEAKQVELVRNLFGDGNSDIPERMQTWEFSTFPSGIDQNARSQVEHFVNLHKTGDDQTSKRGLYIVGPPGRGKTGLGVCAIKEFRRAGHLSLFVSTADLMRRLRATFGKESTETEDELLKAVVETSVIVLDDLGVERPTPYVLEQLYLIIDKRHNRNLYTIFTSNMGMSALDDYWNPSKQTFHHGTRIIERMREYCSGVAVKGENLRASV